MRLLTAVAFLFLVGCREVPQCIRAEEYACREQICGEYYPGKHNRCYRWVTIDAVCSRCLEYSKPDGGGK